MLAPTITKSPPTYGLNDNRGRGGHCPSYSCLHYINYQLSHKNLDNIYQILYNVVVANYI